MCLYVHTHEAWRFGGCGGKLVRAEARYVRLIIKHLRPDTPLGSGRPSALSTDTILSEVDRIVSSQTFHGAGRSGVLLRFVVEQR